MQQSSPFLRLPFKFDAARLAQDYQILRSANWLPHYNNQAHEGAWNCLPLRSAGGHDAHIMAEASEIFADTHWLQHCPYFIEVLSQFKCEKLAVRLMSLAAGARIRPHRDLGGGLEDGIARLHIPIITCPDIIFIIDGITVHFAQAECWYMNANCEHAVINPSALEQIHLVVDCVPNTWLTEVFLKAGWRAKPTSKYADPNINDDNVDLVIASLLANHDVTSQRLAQELLSQKNSTDIPQV